MKFAILLLAFFIPLLTSTWALSCYQCGEREGDKTDCSKSNGAENFCDFDKVVKPEDTYCYTYNPDFPREGNHFRRGCKDLTDDKHKLKSAICKLVDDETDNGDICVCNTDLCNVRGSGSGRSGDSSQNKTAGSNSNKIVGMSVTTLLGGVLTLSLLK